MTTKTSKNNIGLKFREILNALIFNILEDQNTLDHAILDQRDYAELIDKDKNLIHHLVVSFFRHYNQLDCAIIDQLQNKKILSNKKIYMLLKLGATEILYSQIEAYATINCYVELSKSINNGVFSKLVNAILRNIDRQKVELLEKYKDDSINCPDWLKKALRKSHGLDKAKLIIAAQVKPAPLDLIFKEIPKDWHPELNPVQLSAHCLRLINFKGDLTELDGFDDGLFWVQDYASSLAVELIRSEIKGKNVIDLCAAPGGKTMQAISAGADVTAIDHAYHRLTKLEDNLIRTRLAAELLEADATVWQPDAPADYVIVDAPCSATGTIRRHSELAYIKSQSQVDELSLIQAKILENASAMVKTGSRILYITCSLLKEEGEDQIMSFLKNHPEFEIVPLDIKDQPHLQLSAKGWLRTFPYIWEEQGGMDGFFICLLEKK